MKIRLSRLTMTCVLSARTCVLLILGALAAVTSARADEGASEGRTREAGVWVEQARVEVEESRLPQALASLDSALDLAPDHFGARLLRAKIHSWQGRHAEAETGLAALLAERPADAEIRLALSYLRYYQGRLPEASAGFEALLRENPEDEDARSGLAAVLRAQAPPPPVRLWRVDAGGEVSAFTRREQSGWNHQFIQLGRRLPGEKTTVHGRVEHYRQFEMTDVALEVGIYRSVLPRLNTAFALAWAVAPDFRPDWKLAGDAEILALSGKTGKVPAVRLLAGARYDVYENTEMVGFNPGLRLGRDSWASWAFTARLNRVREVGGDALYGWNTRLDGPLPSLRFGGLRFWAGYADAPETLVRAGTSGALVETILTRTVFAGVGVGLEDWLINAGYTRDDREDSWVRHAMSASVARRF